MEEQHTTWKKGLDKEARYHYLLSHHQIGPTVPEQFYFKSEDDTKRYIIMQSFVKDGRSYTLSELLENQTFKPEVIEEQIRELFQKAIELKLNCIDQKPDNFLCEVKNDKLRIVFTDFGSDWCCDHIPTCPINECTTSYSHPWLRAMIMMLQISVLGYFYHKKLLFNKELMVLWFIVVQAEQGFEAYRNQLIDICEETHFEAVMNHYCKSLSLFDKSKGREPKTYLIEEILSRYNDKLYGALRIYTATVAKDSVLEYLRKYDPVLRTAIVTTSLLHQNLDDTATALQHRLDDVE